jgi:repressor LexA
MLTASQHKTYQFIKDYLRNYGYAPTEAEIAMGIGIKSRGVVHRYVHALKDAGYIQVLPGKRRNIILSDTAQAEYGLPLVGKIAAGKPIEAVSNYEMVDLAQYLIGPNRFVLKVCGDSMIGDNIMDGDYVVCESRATATNGEIVVALIDNQEATLKRLQREQGNMIKLLPSNPSLQPMFYEAERVNIQGVYLGLLRLPGS